MQKEAVTLAAVIAPTCENIQLKHLNFIKFVIKINKIYNKLPQINIKMLWVVYIKPGGKK